VVLFAHDSLQGVAGELQLASVKIVFLSLFMFVCWVGGGGSTVRGSYGVTLHVQSPYGRQVSSVSLPVTVTTLQSVASSADR